MSDLTVNIPWTPRAKGRPRFSKTGVPYTPKETKIAEEAVRDAFMDAVGPDFEPYEGPIELYLHMSNENIEITIQETEDYTQRKLRGDVDNYIKLISDALNGIAYDDDKQIVRVMGEKL